MNYRKINLHCSNISIDGLYFDSGYNSPLVIIINGHNGFYNYGMFPYIQQRLLDKRISSYSFNFSHGGVIGESDVFEELDKYEKNCIRLEVEDVLCVLKNVTDYFKKHSRVFLLSHSLGGIPAIFAARQATGEKIGIDGIVLLNSVKTLNFWPNEMIEEWKSKGVYHKKNNRTKQDLPLGKEFLEEILHCDERWNVEKEIKLLTLPIMIIHGENDEAVPVEHGRSLFDWIKTVNSNASLKIIPGATHTFNTSHPFEGPSPQLDEMINIVSDWINMQ